MILIFGFLSTILIVTAGANIVSATLTQTAECGGCHDNAASININTDVTGTVAASVDEPFTVTIDATGGAILLRIEKSWSTVDNDMFDYSTQVVHDNGAGDTNSAEGEISVEIEVTPLVGGQYTLRIWVGGEYPNANSVDIEVDVEGATTGFTPTEPVDPAELISIWYTMMFILIPLVGIIMIILAIYIIRRA